jgi:hypothetical protein
MKNVLLVCLLTIVTSYNTSALVNVVLNADYAGQKISRHIYGYLREQRGTASTGVS